MNHWLTIASRASLLAVLAVGLLRAQTPDPAIAFAIDADAISWQPAAAHGTVLLRIADAKGGIVERTFDGAQALRFDLAQQKLQDGSYRYELFLAPPSPLVTRGDTAVAKPVPGQRMSGVFSVSAGHFVLPAIEPTASHQTAGVQAGARALAGGASIQDLVSAGNSEFQGSLCVGLDCVNNENFGFDTLRLKENNTRLSFADTSNVAGDPATSWEIVANDSASGGANYLGIGEGQGNPPPAMPFSVIAGAPGDTLHVAGNGNVGIRMPAAASPLHILSKDTPAIRQDQSNAGGFTAQIWDVAGNEANFFVRDVTGGSRLPFRIRPGAPESTIDIAGNGNVGVATPRPRAPLHLFRVDGTTHVLIEETDGIAGTRTLAELANNGPVSARLAYSDTAGWTATADAAFRFANSGGATALSLDAAGNLTVPGTLSQGSSWLLKHDISALNVDVILERLRNLPVYTWQYLADAADTRHAGPMAEDVHGEFGLGESPRTLAPGDVAGLAAAATQSLARELEAKDAELDKLMRKLETLERRLDAEDAP